jgi:hypothetical protein
MLKILEKKVKKFNIILMNSLGMKMAGFKNVLGLIDISDIIT